MVVKRQQAASSGRRAADCWAPTIRKVYQMIKTFRDLIVYQKAFEQAMKIFEITTHFPKVEQYSLTDQIR
jgi:hypothetical protein